MRCWSGRCSGMRCRGTFDNAADDPPFLIPIYLAISGGAIVGHLDRCKGGPAFCKLNLYGKAVPLYLIWAILASYFYLFAVSRHALRQARRPLRGVHFHRRSLHLARVMSTAPSDFILGALKTGRAPHGTSNQSWLEGLARRREIWHNMSRTNCCPGQLLLKQAHLKQSSIQKVVSIDFANAQIGCSLTDNVPWHFC